MSFAAPALTGARPDQYRQLIKQLDALIGNERDAVANMANMAALLFCQLPGLNWAGFYLLRGSELVLGPFQGQPACVRIAPGRGVCGAAAASATTQRVADVHEFPGHIACDAASRSEIVVPLISAGTLVGVLDLDSPLADRFDADDAAGLEAAARLLVARSAALNG